MQSQRPRVVKLDDTRRMLGSVCGACRASWWRRSKESFEERKSL